MRTILVHIHSFMAYVFLATAIISTISSGTSLVQRGHFGSTLASLAKMACISSHIQLALGIILWFTSDILTQLQTNASVIMSNKDLRFVAIEHPMANLLAVIILSIGYFSISKSTEHSSKLKKNFFFYLLAVIISMSRLPYEQWLH